MDMPPRIAAATCVVVRLAAAALLCLVCRPGHAQPLDADVANILRTYDQLFQSERGMKCAVELTWAYPEGRNEESEFLCYAKAG